MSPMKALILAAGRGKRLEGHEEQSRLNKSMLTLGKKHLIEYSLESAQLSQVSEVIIVVGYHAEDIINAFGIQYADMRIQYVFQQEQQGLVHALEQARPALDGADFILFLSDEVLIDPRPMEMVRLFEERDLFTVCGVTEVEDQEQIKQTYSIIYNPDDNAIYRLIEKPRNPINRLMGTGNCIFRNAIFDYLPYTPINYFRGEKELPDLIQCAIDDGKQAQLFHIAAQYININTLADIARAEKLLGGA